MQKIDVVWTRAYMHQVSHISNIPSIRFPDIAQEKTVHYSLYS